MDKAELLRHTLSDKDIREISAFTGTQDLLHSMTKHGYVPTVHPSTDTHRRVRAALLVAGFRVFPYTEQLGNAPVRKRRHKRTNTRAGRYVCFFPGEHTPRYGCSAEGKRDYRRAMKESGLHLPKGTRVVRVGDY